MCELVGLVLCRLGKEAIYLPKNISLVYLRPSKASLSYNNVCEVCNQMKENSSS